jgi:hypothetical protein
MSHHDNGKDFPKLKLVKSPVSEEEHHHSHSGSSEDLENKHPDHTHVHETHGHHEQHDPSMPKFEHHHEAQPVELFYDLFFVANLTTFTANHNINTIQSEQFKS